LNEELKHFNKNKPQPNVAEKTNSMAEEKWKKKKYKNRYKMGEAITHLKDVKEKW
jgi:hypothetical protein